ncbi:MAG TPA: prepilin peptidase [Gemmatimonadaceae bacterium]|nr:prepilin peptidase [Gemmatimonadaceae bacterium]
MSPLPAFDPIFRGVPAGALFGGAFLLLVAFACVSDVRARRIPNALVAVLATAGIAFSVVRLAPLAGLGSALSGMALGLAIWIAFYALGLLGAGDVKFFAAAAAWLGPAGAWRASLIAAAIGGVLAVGFLLRAPDRPSASGSVGRRDHVAGDVERRGATPIALRRRPGGGSGGGGDVSSSLDVRMRA